MPASKQLLGGIMAYKKIEQYLSFAGIAINQNSDKNRSLLFLPQVRQLFFEYTANS